MDRPGSYAPSFVELDGRRFEYEDLSGDQGGPPLLFLHEGLGSVGLWRGFHRRVARATHRRTVAYSRLGHGWSDVPLRRRTPVFMHHEATAVLPPLLERLAVSDPVLIGHSDGASIALLYANTHPATGLIAMAPHVFVEDSTVRGIEQARDAYREGSLRDRMRRYHRDVDVTFWEWNNVWLDPAFRDWNIESSLPGVSCPLLLIQGERDQYGSFAQLDAIERGVSGSVRRMAMPCQHSPHLECPEQTLKAIVEFVSICAAEHVLDG